MNAHIQKATSGQISRRSGGFTLAEATIGVGILALFAAACFSGIMFNRLASMKVKEQAIAMDFLVHYVEMVKALPFNEVTYGVPINPLFDGAGGSPRITIPANQTAVAINTTAFENFHPDLIYFNQRNPKLQVTLTSQTVGGAVHDKHLNVKITWDAPLGRSTRMREQLDLLRTKDL